VMDSAQRKVSEGEWEQATTLIVASNKNEILMDQFAEANLNAVKLIEFAHSTGFNVHTNAGKEFQATTMKYFSPAIIQQNSLFTHREK
jgi:hypothetical protein